MMYNFSPGPGVLFRDVLTYIQIELFNWNNRGMSILELNHRSEDFRWLLMNTKCALRGLLNVPSNYEILFLQGGATQMFSTIPLNFTSKDDTVDYIVNGYWSHYAATEASKFCNVNICNRFTSENYTTPKQSDLFISSQAKYVHYCDNETIQGYEFDYVPDVGDKPLICDMSSNLLSKPIDITKFAMIYAGSHKNIGPVGMVLVIIRNDMFTGNRDIPTMMNLSELCRHDSMLNTPPIFPIYVANLTFNKLFSMGGLQEIEAINREKARLLYNTIDNSNGFYENKVNTQYRSRMNVPFQLKTEQLEKDFIEQAKQKKLIGLNGHHTVGHCRASLYNAMSIEGVTELCNFMVSFMNQS